MGALEVISSVPILTGRANFEEWRVGLKVALDSYDEDMWPIIVGQSRAALTQRQETPDIGTVRAALHLELGKEPTEEEIQTWLTAQIRQPNAEFDWFRKRHKIAKYLIYCALTPAARRLIVNLDDAHDIFAKLRTTYDTSNHRALAPRWYAFNALKYHANGNPQTFISKWGSALEEVNSCPPNERSYSSGTLPRHVQKCDSGSSNHSELHHSIPASHRPRHPSGGPLQQVH